MGKVVLGVIVVLVIALVIMFGWNFTGNSNKPGGVTIIDKSNDASGIDNSQITSVDYDVKFILTGKNFKYLMDGVDNPEIRVNEGDTVRIEFSSVGGSHDWVLDEFGATTSIVRIGGSTFVEFVADKKGTFEYYCSVGSHRAQGMFGKFVVE